MTEKSEVQNQENNPQVKKDRARHFFLVKLVFVLALIFFGYYAFSYIKIQRESKQTVDSNHEKSLENESGIFDLGADYKAQSDVDLSEMTVNELKEKGAEFIYQMLLKNQVQIEDLRTQIQLLKADILRNKNQERIGKMILAYVDFRDKLSSGKNYSDSLKNFEILSALDQNLQNKVAKLKLLLPELENQKQLAESFKELIPSLIGAKNNNKEEKGLVAKIRKNISGLIVIRRVDGKNPEEVDGAIVRIEKFLQEENYQDALNAALSLQPNYHDVLKDFLAKLNNALEVQKIDQEIYDYLKSLT